MFLQQSPIRPYGFTLSEYVNNVITHRQNLIDNLKNIDISFNENNIVNYLNNFNFFDTDFIDIHNWMNAIIGGDNILYPSNLLVGPVWSLSQFRQVFAKLTLESDISDVNKMFQAFEIISMNYMLEVI